MPFPKNITPIPPGPHVGAPERIESKVEKLWRKRERALLVTALIKRNQRPIAIVQPAPSVPLEVVVVGPADVDMRVDSRYVCPVVVGVGGDVRREQRRSEQHVQGARQSCPRMSNVASTGGRSGSSARIHACLDAARTSSSCRRRRHGLCRRPPASESRNSAAPQRRIARR